MWDVMESYTCPQSGINYRLHHLTQKFQQDNPPGVFVPFGDQN